MVIPESLLPCLPAAMTSHSVALIQALIDQPPGRFRPLYCLEKVGGRSLYSSRLHFLGKKKIALCSKGRRLLRFSALFKFGETANHSGVRDCLHHDFTDLLHMAEQIRCQES